MPLSDFFSFLGSGERQIVNQILGLLDISSESARHVLKQVELLKNYDYEGVDREFGTIDESEDEGLLGEPKPREAAEHRLFLRGDS